LAKISHHATLFLRNDKRVALYSPKCAGGTTFNRQTAYSSFGISKMKKSNLIVQISGDIVTLSAVHVCEIGGIWDMRVRQEKGKVKSR